MSDLLQVIVTATCYFIFNREFFRVVESILQEEIIHFRHVIWTFLCNYLVFLFCSTLEFHLIVNWIIFSVLLWAELRIILHRPILVCLSFSLSGTLLGLAINILCRSLFATALNIPLVAFDNQVSLEGNLKLYPVVIGFLLTAFLFYITRRYQTLQGMNLVFKDKENLLFLNGLWIAMYLYLCLNLIVYYNGENILVVKLWSMKSSIFVLAGEMLAATFAMRLAQLNAYRKESQRSRQIMNEERQREQELRVIAISDPLTGCENRLQLEKRLQIACENHQRIYLAFLDLNGLKYVNDTFGHEMGDMYLLTLTQAIQDVYQHPHTLYRYGGDEFIILFEGIEEAQIIKNLTLMQEYLTRDEKRKGYAFTMSFSYGIASLSEGFDMDTILHLADERMYEMKQRMHKASTL